MYSIFSTKHHVYVLKHLCFNKTEKIYTFVGKRPEVLHAFSAEVVVNSHASIDTAFPMIHRYPSYCCISHVRLE